VKRRSVSGAAGPPSPAGPDPGILARSLAGVLLALAALAPVLAAPKAAARQPIVPLSSYTSYTVVPAGGIGSPALSPDGLWIAYLHAWDPVGLNPGARSRLFLASLDGSLLVQVTADSIDDPRSPVFSLDGTLLYFTGEIAATGRRELFRVLHPSGLPERVTFQDTESGFDDIGHPVPAGNTGACFDTRADLLHEELNLGANVRNLYRTDVGAPVTRLTNPGVHPLRKAFAIATSVDGTKVAYAAEDPALPGSRPFRPWVLDLAGGSVVPITPALGSFSIEAGTSPFRNAIVFSSTADYIGRSSSTTPQVFRAAVTGDMVQQLTDAPGSGAEAPSADSSAARAVFESRAGILFDDTIGETRVYVREGGVIRRLSTGSAAALSIDGSRVAYVSDSDSLGLNGDSSPEIFSVLTDGTDRRQHSRFVAGASESPDISTDGVWITFTSTADLTGMNPDGSREIFTVKSDGTLLTQVTQTVPPRACREPSISADGRFVVFASNGNLAGSGNVDSNYEIFRVNVDGSSLVQVSRTSGGTNSLPAVSGEGDLVAFISTGNVVTGASMGLGRVAIWRDGESTILVTPASDRPIENLRLDDEGTKVAILTTGNLGGRNSMHARRPFTSETTNALNLFAVPVPGSIQASSLAMSPDGLHIATAGIDGMLKVTPSIGGKTDTVFASPGVIATWPGLSNNADVVIFSVLGPAGIYRPGDVYVLRRGAGTPIPVIEPAAASNPRPAALSGDGSRAAFVMTGRDSLNPDGSTEVFSAAVGTTAVRLHRFELARGDDGIHLEWMADPDGDHRFFEVERAPAPSGPWETVASAIGGRGPQYSFVDRSAPDSRLWYVLAAMDRMGGVERFGPIEAPALSQPSGPRLEVRRSGPDFYVSIFMHRPDRAMLKLFDVSGRLVDTLLDAIVPAGRTDFHWSGRTQHGTKVASGVYYLRLNLQPAQSIVLSR
jgi:Tol biopolymer transport system component